MLLLVLILTSWARLINAHLHPSWLLNDGNQIPAIAFGTFGEISEIESIGPAVVTAVEAGFRLIDTGYIYMNEEVIGDAILNVTSRGIVKRRELFISTKLSIFTGREAVVPALKQSLAKLKLDHVDLYLIHTSRNQTTGEEYDYLDIWKGMEDAKMLGLTNSIGISNFNSSQINKILSHSKIRPAVHQIEVIDYWVNERYFTSFTGIYHTVTSALIVCNEDKLELSETSDFEDALWSVLNGMVNPTMATMDLVAYCQSEDIRVMSYGPFGFAVPRVFNNKTLPPSFDDPILVDIAKKYGKTSSQIFLRYLIDRDTIPIPKSTNKDHIKSNIDVFDFRLTRKEVYKISEFDINTAVYLQNGRFPADLFSYIFGASVEELYKAQMS